MNNITVSVIIAVRNGARFLETAIESVLKQDYMPIEIIIVDGHSTDNTTTIVNSYKDIICISQTNKGVSDAYNLGIKTARGELVAFLSHDDLWVPEKLSTQATYMEQHSDIQFTVANFKYFLEKGCNLPAGFRKSLLEGCHVGRVMETLVARKTVFEKVGFFDTSLTTAEDVDWFSRASDQNVAMAVLPQVLLNKRVHDKNISLNIDQNNTNLLSALRKSVQRKNRLFEQ
jgi:glycosyltransferase involved in cell wall biosynthesis